MIQNSQVSNHVNSQLALTTILSNISYNSQLMYCFCYCYFLYVLGCTVLCIGQHRKEGNHYYQSFGLCSARSFIKGYYIRLSKCLKECFQLLKQIAMIELADKDQVVLYYGISVPNYFDYLSIYLAFGLLDLINLSILAYLHSNLSHTSSDSSYRLLPFYYSIHSLLLLILSVRILSGN